MQLAMLQQFCLS